jgi:pimeloyl-ACP methyl ester carboxylesterase
MAPLVLLHPFPLSGEAFAGDVAELASYRWLTPDLTASSIDAMADDVASLLDDKRIPRAFVGGLSMGGYVSLAFARRHPDRLQGLILGDTRAEPDSDEARAGREVAITRIEAGDSASYLESLLAKLTVKRHDVVDRIAGEVSPERLVTTLRALRDRPDARPGLRDIRVPTLVLVGSEDTVTPPAVAEAMHAEIHGSKLIVIPNAGHLSNFDNPRAFRDALTAFLNDHAED